jgi:hypothetical protein
MRKTKNSHIKKLKETCHELCLMCDAYEREISELILIVRDLRSSNANDKQLQKGNNYVV